MARSNHNEEGNEMKLNGQVSLLADHASCKNGGEAAFHH